MYSDPTYQNSPPLPGSSLSSYLEDPGKDPVQAYAYHAPYPNYTEPKFVNAYSYPGQEPVKKTDKKPLYKRIGFLYALLTLCVISLVGAAIYIGWDYYLKQRTGQSIFPFSQRVDDLQNVNQVYSSVNDELNQKIRSMQEEIADLTRQLDESQKKVAELEEGARISLAAIEEAYQQNNWQSVITMYQNLINKYPGSEEAKTAREYYQNALREQKEEWSQLNETLNNPPKTTQDMSPQVILPQTSTPVVTSPQTTTPQTSTPQTQIEEYRQYPSTTTTTTTITTNNPSNDQEENSDHESLGVTVEEGRNLTSQN